MCVIGAIGGLLGIGGGNSGTGYSTPSGTNAGQLQTAYTNANNAIGNQQQVYGQLQNVAAGQGPNPAQAMLNQATSGNVQNQAALQAGQRGAAQNVGLIARQAGQQGMQAQQQAAVQGASMQAQQALNALQGAGNMATGITAAQQGEQGILQGANTANNQVQGQLANTTMQGQQGLLGGLGNAIGSVTHLFAGGGDVQKMADGGLSGTGGPSSMFAQYINQANPGSTPQFTSNTPKALFGNNGPSAAPQANPMAGATNAMPSAGVPGGNQSAGSGAIPTNGGFIDPSQTDQTFTAAQGGNVGSKLKQGGGVPGKAAVKGNSYKNDTVKALLSPGEVVIPKSVMEGKDPIRGAAQFVQAVMRKKGSKS
jgi:hypothetical protein